VIDEQVTFDGIPIPLGTETILDAMITAQNRYVARRYSLQIEDEKCLRQYHAFRARILRMFEVGKAINADLVMEIEMRDARIAELEADSETLNNYCSKVDREKVTRIVELEAALAWANSNLKGE